MSEERRNIRFAVYYNNPRGRVVIHRIGCNAIELHGGEHNYDQGGWGYFVEERVARLFAEAMSKAHDRLNVKNCERCI